ncbi:RNA-directed DNA polymerase, eukaryota [Tanacetum coccineum]
MRSTQVLITVQKKVWWTHGNNGRRRSTILLKVFKIDYEAGFQTLKVQLAVGDFESPEEAVIQKTVQEEIAKEKTTTEVENIKENLEEIADAKQALNNLSTMSWMGCQGISKCFREGSGIGLLLGSKGGHSSQASNLNLKLLKILVSGDQYNHGKPNQVHLLHGVKKQKMHLLGFKPPSAATNFRFRKRGRHEKSPSKTRLLSETAATISTKLIKHTGVLSWFSELGHANNLFVSDVRLVWTAIEGLPICAWNKDAIAKIVSPCGRGIKIIVKGKIYWIRIRELEAWSPEFDDKFQSTQGDDPSHPPGFTPKDDAAKGKEEDACSVNQFSNNGNSLNNGVSSVHSGVNRSFSLKSGGSIMDVIENLVDIGQTMGYNMEGCKKNLEDIVASHGDSQLESIDLFSIKELWGNFSFDFTFSPSVGFSVGILCVWDPNIFVKDNATISDSFVAVRGTWMSSSTKLMIVSVYAPQDLSEKKSLWEYITHIIDLWDGECIILGDFNKVRSEHERFGTIFSVSGAKAFNHFISTSSLIDLPLKGYSYTWSIKSASKMSKLDRFLVSEGLLMLFPSLSSLCLERHLSDHRPIIMREVVADYGPSPFRVYHSWFTKDGFDKLVEDSWKTSSFADSSKITILRKKFQALKASIKAWCKDDKQRSSEYRLSIQSRLSDLDKMFDSGHSNEDLVNERTSLLKELHNINKCHSLDMAQKAKVRWSIEGDENSKFFHGIINMKRSQLAIRGVLIEGDWIDKPYKVKNEFLNHFSNRFARPTGPNIVLDSNMFKQLSSEQIADLECDVTYDEIKRAVWDCGTNKSPGPDGFTFDFIRTYWKIINQDVVNAVREFFVTSKFPPGSNSSFIALIPKKQDAKLVKDFRPISLIGCFYKIIAKILANRLSMVISDLISDVQSAFVPNRQILDGPFILNELISWCKFHKSKAMIFKVDFEKAFDSVRWDYLDGILSNFGFGSKWREWIHGSSSAMGSILLNGALLQNSDFIKDEAGRFPYLLFFYLGNRKTDDAPFHRMYALENKIIVLWWALEEEQYLSLVDIVASVVLSNSNDRWVWSLDSAGEFTVKSAHMFIDDSFLPSVGSSTRWIKHHQELHSSPLHDISNRIYWCKDVESNSFLHVHRILYLVAMPHA